jgi:hypothetical protein
MSNNVIFTDDKLRIQFTNQKNFFSGGSVSILYNDISSLSLIKNPSKIPYILTGAGSILFALYLSNYGPNYANNFLIGFGLLIIILGLIMPSNYLGVETRGGSQYWVNVKGRNIYEIIDEIEEKRKQNTLR